jgi:HD-GYP domain-containing protein (c-di-GMP phosphodiesterase class II)
VDVWDAMTSDRPYRKAISENETIQYITEQAGKHFDPIIVQSFLRLVSQSNQNTTIRADR